VSGRYEGPPGSGGPVDDARWHEPPHPAFRPVRAAFVLVVVIVIGILLLPSATRSPKTPAATTGAPHSTTTLPSSTTTTTVPPTTTTVPAVAYSSIKVLVANGTNSAHGASTVRAWLGTKGFDVTPFPAYDTTVPESVDAIYVVNGGTTAMATEVAEALALTGSVVHAAGQTPPVSTTTGADVIVVLGTDLSNRANSNTLGVAPSSTTTTS
jgi:hypothetical protein